MRVHELRKTLAWYSRGLYGGSQLRQRASPSMSRRRCSTSARRSSPSCEARRGGRVDPATVARRSRRQVDGAQRPSRRRARRGAPRPMPCAAPPDSAPLAAPSCSAPRARTSRTRTSATRSTSSCAATTSWSRPRRSAWPPTSGAAIPQIETSLHTSAPTGRLHLVAAHRLASATARRCRSCATSALYDITPDVRQAAEGVLARWAAGRRRRAARRAARRASAEIARSAPPARARCCSATAAFPARRRPSARPIRSAPGRRLERPKPGLAVKEVGPAFRRRTSTERGTEGIQASARLQAPNEMLSVGARVAEWSRRRSDRW